MTAVVAGIDSSTQSCTVVLRNLDDGATVAVHSSRHPRTTPPVSEQHPTAWWTALGEALAESRPTVPREQIVALSVDAQAHGLVPVDGGRERHPPGQAVERHHLRTRSPRAGRPPRPPRMGTPQRQRAAGRIHHQQGAVARPARAPALPPAAAPPAAPRLADLPADRATTSPTRATPREPATTTRPPGGGTRPCWSWSTPTSTGPPGCPGCWPTTSPPAP